jgi:hemolysin III
MAVFAAVPLMLRAMNQPDMVHMISLSIFIISMILLYAASTIYHTLDISPKVNEMLKKMDHMMIFILIAGTYTPICTIAIGGQVGYGLLALVWSIAVVGIAIKAFWIHCPKWFSSVLYIGMGWVCVLAFTQLLNALSASAFGWLLAGGIIYTIGGVIYALKLPLFDERHKNFGTHEIFHLFVMAGSACHFIVMYSYVAPMPLA